MSERHDNHPATTAPTNTVKRTEDGAPVEAPPFVTVGSAVASLLAKVVQARKDRGQ